MPFPPPHPSPARGQGANVIPSPSTGEGANLIPSPSTGEGEGGGESPQRAGEHGPRGSAPERQPAPLRRVFEALTYPEFRLLWLGQLCQGSASFGERVTRSWLALQLTGSAFQLGALELLRGLASLAFGLWGGVLADRVDKRTLLTIVQGWTCACYAVMAWLVLSGNLQVWHLYASAIALSLSGAVIQPVRGSLIPSLIPDRLLINALSLNSIATNATRMGAPAAIAALIQLTGNGGWGYVVSGGLYLLVAVFTAMIRAAEAVERPALSIWGSLVEGWSFMVRHRPILTQLIVGVGPLTIAFNYQAMLVVYTTATLHQGAAAYGVLYSFAGLGALLGGLTVAAMGAALRRGRLLLVAGLLNGTALLALGALGFFPTGWLVLGAAAVLLMLAGGSQTSFRAANNGLLLANTPRGFRGRVMSMDEVFRSAGAIVAPAVGALADSTNAAAAMAAIGAGSLLVVVAVQIWQPHLRNL